MRDGYAQRVLTGEPLVQGRRRCRLTKQLDNEDACVSLVRSVVQDAEGASEQVTMPDRETGEQACGMHPDMAGLHVCSARAGMSG